MAFLVASPKRTGPIGCPCTFINGELASCPRPTFTMIIPPATTAIELLDMCYTAAVVPVIEATGLVSCTVDANRVASTPRTPSSNLTATFARLYKANRAICRSQMSKSRSSYLSIRCDGDDAFFQDVLHGVPSEPSFGHARWLEPHRCYYEYRSQILKYPAAEWHTDDTWMRKSRPICQSVQSLKYASGLRSGSPHHLKELERR
jgi:hypothetical protein